MQRKKRYTRIKKCLNFVSFVSNRFLYVNKICCMYLIIRVIQILFFFSSYLLFLLDVICW